VDSWAIGVVFFTLLTGSPPFQIASIEDPGFRYLKTMGVGAFLSAWPGLPLALSDVHHAFLLEHLLEAHDPAKRLTARDIRQMTRLDALVSSFMVVNHAREVLLAT
jgi:serine/threonine protein kinase